MNLLIAVVMVVLLMSGWYFVMYRDKYRQSDALVFIAENLPFLGVAVDKVRSLQKRYCPEDAGVIATLDAAQAAFDAAVDLYPGADENTIYAIEGIVRGALATVSEARTKVHTYMTEEQIDEDEWGVNDE